MKKNILNVIVFLMWMIFIFWTYVFFVDALWNEKKVEWNEWSSGKITSQDYNNLVLQVKNNTKNIIEIKKEVWWYEAFYNPHWIRLDEVYFKKYLNENTDNNIVMNDADVWELEEFLDQFQFGGVNFLYLSETEYICDYNKDENGMVYMIYYDKPNELLKWSVYRCDRISNVHPWKIESDNYEQIAYEIL